MKIIIRKYVYQVWNLIKPILKMILIIIYTPAEVEIQKHKKFFMYIF